MELPESNPGRLLNREPTWPPQPHSCLAALTARPCRQGKNVLLVSNNLSLFLHQIKNFCFSTIRRFFYFCATYKIKSVKKLQKQERKIFRHQDFRKSSDTWRHPRRDVIDADVSLNQLQNVDAWRQKQEPVWRHTHRQFDSTNFSFPLLSKENIRLGIHWNPRPMRHEETDVVVVVVVITVRVVVIVVVVVVSCWLWSRKERKCQTQKSKKSWLTKETFFLVQDVVCFFFAQSVLIKLALPQAAQLSINIF